jgi:uncharacterized repeat protein (TIGR02059 family)
MKKLLIIPLLLISLLSSATTYYVSTTGSNNNSGTLSSPFATINKAWSVVSAGDIIYVRGGTYTYAMMGQTVLSGKSGSAGNLITISNYPGESPVINFSSSTFTSQVMGIWVHDANYLYLKGIRITSINQPSSGSVVQYGLILYDHASNCTFEQIETDHIGGWGVHISDYCNNNLFLNCDSHHNSDRYSSDSWGGSDGFQSNSWNESSQSQASTGNIFRGCRAWRNSDDGWDLRRSEGTWTLENCWSFWNGFQPGERVGDADSQAKGGDGMGLKFGTNYGAQTTAIRKSAKNCLIFENNGTGVDLWTDAGSNYTGYLVENCVTYKNGDAGIGCSDATGASTTTLRNNISYANPKGNYFASTAWWIHDHNNWDIPITVTDADFAGVNSAGMDGPRQADGSLPNISFLHLTSGSKLIDAGVNVGMPFSGNSPDLGAFEGGTGITITVPVYTSSAVQNTAPSILEMTYNTTLANIVPAVSAFTVKVNSVVRTVSSVAISGTKVQLTLASPVVTGDVITVSYTIPASNQVQTTSGGQASTITAQVVTNNVISAIPAYVSSAVANATPTILEMTYNMALANIVPAASAFSVKVNSVVRTVNSVVISGTKVQLALASPVVAADVITVSYTIPASNQVQTTSGGKASTITAQAVKNNVISVIPAYVSSAVANTTPTILEMTYNIALANIVPTVSAFTVKVNSVVRTVSSVAISGSKVQLTLASPVVAGDVITVSYTIPASNQVQTTSGGKASTITAQSVTNNVISVMLAYVSSAVANATPTILEMTYNMVLATTAPAAASFKVNVNLVANTISKVVISGSKVQLTLASAIKFGDNITVSYTKPATNPLQSTTGSVASAISDQTVINNLINTSKDVTPLTITMSISPNYVHHIVNIVFAYSGTATSPENIRILDNSGQLYIDKSFVAGVAAIRIPINLSRGIYTVQLLSGGLQMTSQKIMVF